MRFIKRKTIMIMVVVAFGTLTFLAGSVLAASEDYPARPINIYIGFAPGGSVGNSAPIFFEAAKKYLPKPQNILLNYKPGAQTAIAADFVLKQPADGYSLYLFPPDLCGKLAKDGPQLSFKMEDFIQIGSYMFTPQFLIVNREKSPFKTVEDFIDYAKKNPGKLSFGSVGVGGSGHLSTELFMSATGIKMYMVPFPGGGPYTTALLGGHIDCIVSSAGASGQHIMPGGGLKPLAVLAPKRWPTLPDVPTFLEKGYDLNRSFWCSLAVAKGTPPSVLNILTKMMKQTADDPDVKAKLLKVGFLTEYWSPEETTKKAKEEFDLSYEFYKKEGMPK